MYFIFSEALTGSGGFRKTYTKMTGISGFGGIRTGSAGLRLKYHPVDNILGATRVAEEQAPLSIVALSFRTLPPHLLPGWAQR